MAFEGEPRVIPIKGIARAGADSIVEDGAMNEVIGLEYKDGSFVPYSGETNDKVNVQSDIKKIAVHKTSTQTNIIAITDNALLWLSKDVFDSGTNVVIGQWNVLYDGKVKDIEFVKNIICISTKEKVMYFLFQGGAYKDWTINKENLPRISFRVDIGIGGKEKEVGVANYVTQYNWGSGDEIEVARSTLIAARGKAKEEGGLVGYFIVCAAYRLKTGEYIKASNPVVMCRPVHKAGDEIYNPSTDSPLFSVEDSEGNTQEITVSINNPSHTMYTPFTEEGFGFMKYGRGDFTFLPNTSFVVEEGLKRYQLYGRAFYPTMSCGILLPKPEDHDNARFSAPVPTNKLQYSIRKDIGSEYDNMVDSLCVFMSQEIDPYLDFSDKNSVEDNLIVTREINYYKTIYAVPRSFSYIKEALENINNLYLIHEIPFADVKKSEDWIDINLKGKLGDALVTRTTLPISAFDYSVIKDSSMDTYNSRLHMFNYKEEDRCGYHIEDFNLYGGFGQYSASQEVELGSACIVVDYKDIGGEKRIVKRFTNPTLTMDGSLAMFNPLLGFHMGNATKITFYYGRAGDNYNVGSYGLKKSNHGGYALYLDKDIAPIKVTSDIIAIGIPAEKNPEETKESMRVSDTFLPQTFPNANTYTIGNGTVIGLASLSIALSQDTFGSYPLLVFTTDGIYSMEVDKTGVGVYTNVPPPFSREVCVNPNSICEIDGAVLFASSKGLMIATSQGVQEFVPTMNGLNRHIPKDDNSYGVGLKLYRDIINNSSSTQLLDSVDDELDFRDYVAAHDTYITYVSQKNKIVVYNGNQPYIYWIDIPTRNVTKLPTSIKMDNDNYPTELYVKADGSMLEFNQLSAKGNTQTMFQTRPIKLDGGMKTDYRVVVRGHFESDEQDKIAALLVLGSYDGECWQPIGYKQKSLNGSFNDIGCDTDRVTHKYMMVIFSASLNRNSHIDGIELTKKNKYNNKLK